MSVPTASSPRTPCSPACGAAASPTRTRGASPCPPTSEAFNGFFLAGGASYTLEAHRIAFEGNGRLDFASYGAAVTGAGDGTRLVVDGADIDNRGVVRTGVIARDGANVIVKNSGIRTREGVLPDDHEPGFGANMMTVPWMLGLADNVRATNVLGANTTATYFNSRISSESWGVLSMDSVRNSLLTAINSTVTLTGDSGYGTYADGGSRQDITGQEPAGFEPRPSVVRTPWVRRDVAQR
ncbi:MULTISPECIES: hypothetical protein [unclassified Streptomyces]|uniref:hypothetical protein n=1 Tax=unclassified Streptomyces TaxID=2593676 RepID=UPI00236596B8|nr:MULTISPECIES: hypothetical protein [unclassified Streptomyces]MDF3141298.1 hypothetical protein [Streptomyces sp. T21Q-yed]WDF43274.1 hypothetical protein PBV52_44025 [Streptomyces sp. T12]